MKDSSVENLRLFSIFLIPTVIVASILIVYQPYNEKPLKLWHKTLNRDEYGANFLIREISWSDPLPKTFEVGYTPNPRQYGDYKEHLFYKKLDAYDKVKFSIQSTEPVIFLLRTGDKYPSFSPKSLKKGIIFNGTITDYTWEYKADTQIWLVFHFTTAQPIRLYTARLEYTANVTFNGQFYDFKKIKL